MKNTKLKKVNLMVFISCLKFITKIWTKTLLLLFSIFFLSNDVDICHLNVEKLYGGNPKNHSRKIFADRNVTVGNKLFYVI